MNLSPDLRSDPDLEPMLLQSVENGALHLVMNRPRQRNSLSLAMITALTSALDAAALDDAVRVIILGAKGQAFCAGHDLKEMTAARQHEDGGRELFKATMQACSTLMQTIVNHKRPVIADIRGVATAAGCQMVASCDLAIATTNSRFATPGVNIGLFCSTPMVALSRNIAPKHAMEMLLTGEMVSAAKAAQIGLINRCVEPDKIDEAVNELAQVIAAKSTMTIETGKSAFYQQAQMELSKAYDYAAGVMVENMMKHDACEGINAFVEKRPPVWTDC